LASIATQRSVSGDLVIESSREHASLRLSVERPGLDWRARLDCRDLHAEATFHERYSREQLRLDEFFGGLAEQWRGWDGAMEWEALGLKLSASHDGLGHVALEVSLQGHYARPESWLARASLQLEAGGLEELARAARALDAEEAEPAGN
jgi:hypothetical protein